MFDRIIKEQAAYYGKTVEERKEQEERLADLQETAEREGWG